MGYQVNNLTCMGRCDKCTGHQHMPPFPVIQPDGPVPCEFLFVGERPGIEENNKHRPFIGRTGLEFNDHYLGLAGLDRDRVYVTNTIKCFGEEDSPPEGLATSCAAKFLMGEIEEVNPRIVVLMGATACSVFGYDVEMQHGIPVYSGGRIWLPMFHPALGLHDTRMMKPIADDFKALGLLRRGRLQVAKDEYPEPTYEELETVDDVYDVIGQPYDDACPLFTDTEHDPIENKLWCITASVEPGTGWMARPGTDAFRGLAHWLYCPTRRHDGKRARKVVLHNRMYDEIELWKAGVPVPPQRVIDTMQLSYHTQCQPQSLKQLGFRLCGMVMQEFDEVVLGPSTDVALEYLERASFYDWPKPEEQLIQQPDGSIKLYKPQGMNTKLKRLFTDYSKGAVDVFKRWGDWPDDEKGFMQGVLGTFPKKSIALAPYEKAKAYACRDADATCRVYWKLREIARRLRKAV